MASFDDSIDDELRAAVESQPVFFVATAPPAGRINCSPKGMDTLRVLDPTTVAYVDLTGSGNETAAHIVADGRVTVMVCRFDRPPDIIRLYGHGRVVARDSGEWDELIEHWDEVLPGARQLIVVDVDSVQSSCGYAVPVMELVEERQTLRRWAETRGGDGLREYRAERNATSIDGLPTPALDGGPTG